MNIKNMLEKTGLNQLLTIEEVEEKLYITKNEEKITFQDNLYIILEGWVDINYYTKEGGLYNIYRIVPEDYLILGLIRIDKEHFFNSKVFGVIKKGSLILPIPKEKVKKLYNTSLLFLQKFFDIYGDYSIKLARENFYRLSMNLEEYLCYTFIKYREGDSFYTNSYVDFSQYINYSRSKVYEKIFLLEKEGLIKKEKKKIILIDTERIKEKYKDKLIWEILEIAKKT